jgi:hypothetical protein
MARNTFTSCAARYRRWNRFAYLSAFERRLNRALWLLLVVAVVFAILQHVYWLANIPEKFPGGARLGDVFYEIAIAYIGAFVFYLLVVRLPARRDRRSVYRHLSPLISRVVGEAVALMRDLNGAADVEANRDNTQENIENTCGQIRPPSQANLRLATPTGMVQGTVADLIRYHMGRARDVNRDILARPEHLASEVVDYVVAIDDNSFFRFFDALSQTFQLDGMTDLSVMAGGLVDYLQLVDRLDRYRREFLQTVHASPPELIAGSDRRSDAVPLRQAMNE